ncbi:MULTISPECIES: HepT-like ribonuclease domain-containing protein [Thioalkalivibrio]|uniref:HepT-like ribonuclease domain-containing protein n=1 Tax=Thioalkalivibrio TaxID=106633 RepID=UPI0004784381|nr:MULTISPECIES: HepT-like ribonuclease domain-containing protein [Thioalkalivibrio]
MRRDPRAYVWDAREAARRVAEFVEDANEDGYMASDLMRSAVERQLEILGEALGQLEKADPDLARQIPQLRAAVDLRNLLIHGYAKIDSRIVWSTATTDVPVMARELDSLLRQLDE